MTLAKLEDKPAQPGRKRAAMLMAAIEKAIGDRLVDKHDKAVVALALHLCSRPQSIVEAHGKWRATRTTALRQSGFKSAKWTLAEVLAPLQACWLRRIQTLGKEADEAVALFSKAPECYVTQDGDIGPYLRLLLIVSLIGDRLLASRGGPVRRAEALETSDITRYLKSLVPAPIAEGLPTQFALAFHYGVDNQYDQASHYVNGLQPWVMSLFGFVCTLRAKHGAPPPASLEELFDVRVAHAGEALGQGMFERYRVWLAEGWLPARDELARLHGEPYLGGHPDTQCGQGLRARQLEGILDALLGKPAPDLPDGLALCSRFPVLNLYSPRNWHGTRAFCTELTLRLKARQYEAGRPYGIVYVPLSRGISDGGFVSRGDVTRLLFKALQLDWTQEVGRREAENDLTQLNAVRRELTLRRTLVIFDGLEISAEPFDAVFDLLKHTDWATYIKVLVQPHAQSLARHHGEYQSRFIVLSGQKVRSLAPWLPGSRIDLAVPGVSVRLEDPPDAREALTLIKPEGIATVQGWLDEIRARCAALWPPDACTGTPNGPDTSDHGLTLRRLYGLDATTIARIESHGDAPLRLPDELDMAMLWCAQQSGIDMVLGGAGARHEDEERLAAEQRLLVMRRFLRGQRAVPGETVAIQLVSIAVNGMRVTTLRRCLRAYMQACDPSTEAALIESITELVAALETPSGIDNLALKYYPLLVRGHDEEIDGIGPTQRWFDLQSFHGHLDDQDAACDQTVFDIRSVDLRELILGEMLTPSAASCAQEQRCLRVHFERISRVLSEESLVQATAQLRGLGKGAEPNAYVMRRLVQTIYHGLMSLSFEAAWRQPDAGDLNPWAGMQGTYLPRDPYKRYVYLAEFVFRKCIEHGPDWMLGRGQGRFDVRLSLLTMLLNPSWARRVLASLYKRPLDERRYEDFGALVVPGDGVASDEFQDPFDPLAPYLRGPLGVELFRTLMHSAARMGRHRYVAAMAGPVARALALRQPDARRDAGWDADVGARAAAAHRDDEASALMQTALGALHALLALHASDAPSTPREQPVPDPACFAFAKLAIDAHQALIETEDAQRLCLAWLQCFGVADAARLTILGEGMDVSTMDKARFEHDVLQPIVVAMLAGHRSKAALARVTDTFFRLGELLATTADGLDSNDYAGSAVRYAHAYAVYWIGDRIRSGAATLNDEVAAWPSISARALRYYVRVSLKLAKIAARLGHLGNARLFFAHARGRIDVYTLHLYRLPTERLAMHLLLASAARVWASILRLGSEGPAQEQPCLQVSLDYLRVAEQLLVGLGYINPLARRLFFERFKTLRRLAEIDPERGAVYGRLAARDYAALRRLAHGHPFWEQMVGRILKNEASGRGH